MVSLLDFLRHEEESRQRHEDAAGTHSDPPEESDVIHIPGEDSGHAATAGADAELEFRIDRDGGEEVDADEWVDEAGAAEALAELLYGHRPESLREVCVFADGHVFSGNQGRMSA